MNNPIKSFQWSIKLNNGEIFVVEADDITDLFSKKEEMMKKILKVPEIVTPESSTPVEPEAPPIDNYTEPRPEPTLSMNDYHGTPDAIRDYPVRDNDPEGCDHPSYWVNEVKKEGKNKGKHFKSCTLCKKFLGFTSEDLGFHKGGEK